MNVLKRLMDSSAHVATGDFSLRTGRPSRKGDLGRITRAFDRMAHSLEYCEVERKRTERALQASEMRYRRLFETAQDGILILNADTGRIEDANPFLTQLLGYPRDRFVGNKLWEAGPFRGIEATRIQFQELQSRPYVRHEDLTLETRDGRLVDVDFVSNVYRVDDQKVIQCNIRDITTRKAAEQKRKEYSRQLQALSRRVVEVQETERRHLARELHDELGQTLTVAQLNLQVLLQSAAPRDRRRLTDGLQAIEQALERVHSLALNLRPPMLDDLGLEPALVWLTHRQAELAGLKSEVEAETLDQRLDPVIETECFRIAQEALTNVVRHARAKSVTLRLQKQEGHLHLRVRDDGTGFNVAAIREKAVQGASLGLLSMEERAMLTGGRVEFSSVPGKGTEVHAWFPLKLRIQSGERSAS